MKAPLIPDSKSVLTAMSNNNNTDPKIQILQKKPQYSTAEIILVWVPAHNNIPGNEKADKATRNATKIGRNHTNNEINNDEFKCSMKNYVLVSGKTVRENTEEKLKTIKSKVWEKHLEIRNRKIQSTITRPRIGRTILTHKHLLTKTDITNVQNATKI